MLVTIENIESIFKCFAKKLEEADDMLTTSDVGSENPLAPTVRIFQAVYFSMKGNCYFLQSKT